MRVVLGVLDAFNKSNRAVEGQLAIINKLYDPHTPLEDIGRLRRGDRLKISREDLWYVWKTMDLSHPDRAKAWDEREPKPFRPYRRSNIEMHDDKALSARWRSLVNRLLKEARETFGPHGTSPNAN